MAKKKNEEMEEMKKDAPVSEEVVAETLDDDDTAAGTACADGGDASSTEGEADDRIARLEAENRDLAQQVSELKDRLVRNVADTENYKKRLQRDKDEAVRYANTALVKDLIGPMDDFSRALDAAEQSSNFDALKEGVRMIEDRLYSTLKNNWGLEVIDKSGVPFNPDEHEACLMEDVDGLQEDTVTMMLQKGYKLNGRVIRPAKVKVGRGRS